MQRRRRGRASSWVTRCRWGESNAGQEGSASRTSRLGRRARPRRGVDVRILEHVLRVPAGSCLDHGPTDVLRRGDVTRQQPPQQRAERPLGRPRKRLGYRTSRAAIDVDSDARAHSYRDSSVSRAMEQATPPAHQITPGGNGARQCRVWLLTKESTRAILGPYGIRRLREECSS